MKKCIYCGRELIEFIGTQKEYIGKTTINIINVPLVMCQTCNEEYIQPNTMDIINKIVLSFSEEELSKNDNLTIDFKQF